MEQVGLEFILERVERQMWRVQCRQQTDPCLGPLTAKLRWAVDVLDWCVVEQGRLSPQSATVDDPV